MYQENEGTVGASGGTLQTRAAMSAGDKWVRSVMMNPFALGGQIQGGKRDEDQDRVLTKVFRDPITKTWVAPHVYAFFETRVVRRSNMLHSELVGGPDMGGWCLGRAGTGASARAEARSRFERFHSRL